MSHTYDPPGAASEPDTDAGYWSDCLARVGASGDRQAVAELFRHFAPMVKAFAYRIPSLEHPDSFAEDLLQETMLKVWSKAASFDARLASPSTWIFAIARNMRIDLLRRQARHVVSKVSLSDDEEDGEIALDDIWFEDENSDVFNLLAQQRTRRQLQDSLQSLPPDQAHALEKVFLEDKSHAEVAAELRLPLGTVKSKLRRAMGRLREALEDLR